MDNFEKVEKLREKANVGYEEAKEALENSNWDILDAMIYLEKNGKVFRSGEESYTTNNAKHYAGVAPEMVDDDNDFAEGLKNFGAWCLKWIKKGNNNFFRVTRRGQEVITLPITLLVVLLIFAFWLVLPLLVVGLFFNMRYRFEGPNVRAKDLNDAMDGAADTVENVKNQFNDKNNR